MFSKLNKTFNQTPNYIIQDQIGDGGFSEVYKIKEFISGKAYALKVFNQEKCDESTILKEIKINKIISESNCPYIIKYISSNMENTNKNEFTENFNGDKYMISELATKGELFDYIKIKESGFTDQSCKLTIFKVLKALLVLNQKGICHRDVDPQNIFLDGERYQVKLGDFGLSEFLYNEKGEKVFFKKGAGKISFMAPEMLCNKGYDGAKSDIFSVGVLLFVLKTGKIPFSFDKENFGSFVLKLYSFIKYKKEDKYWEKLAYLFKLKYNLELKLDPLFKDLFLKLVAYNPNERPTIEEILEHPYMIEVSHANEEQFTLYENKWIEELKNIENIMP